MANLLVIAGNTALKAAWSEGMVLGKTFRYQGEKMLDYLLSIIEKEKPEVLTIASVYKVSREEEDLLRKECSHLIILDINHTKYLLKYNLPESLSYDRAAGIIAARYLFKDKACSIFNLGSTLTIDFIETDGSYSGGSISLGYITRFKALERYSRVKYSVDSVESGVTLGIKFEIEGYLSKKPDNITIFTGGDAIYFAKQMKNSIFVVCNLELVGLAIITDEYVKTIIN